MQQVQALHIFPGLCLIIANYPRHPDGKKKKLYHAALTSVFSICRHNPTAPKFLRYIGQKPIPGESMVTRTALATWFFRTLERRQLKQAKLLLTDPTLWGPVVWSMMHGLSAMCRPTDKPAFVTFLEKVPGTLPCEKCSRDFEQLIRASDIDRINLDTHYAESVLQLHRLVNTKVAKQNNTKYIPKFPDTTSFPLTATAEEVLKVMMDYKLLLTRIPTPPLPHGATSKKIKHPQRPADKVTTRPKRRSVNRAFVPAPIHKRKKKRKPQQPRKKGCGCG